MAIKKKRSELVAAIRAGFQRVSGQSVVLSAIIAEKFGLAPSDLECLGFLQLEGPLTAGRLAELTGLTTGAVTRMIDRLEAGKYVRRRDDPADRRRVGVSRIVRSPPTCCATSSRSVVARARRRTRSRGRSSSSATQ